MRQREGEGNQFTRGSCTGARGHMDPMLSYACCVRRFFLTLILLEVPIQYIYMYMTVIDIYIFTMRQQEGEGNQFDCRRKGIGELGRIDKKMSVSATMCRLFFVIYKRNL
jgi:hypothetical protein